MKKPLLLILMLIGVPPVFGQSHVTLLTDTNGNLVAPTNFFAQNSNLLNQAVPPTTGGAAQNYDPLYFGTNPVPEITLTNNLTNWQKLPTNILGTAAQSSTTAFIAAHSGQGSNNIFFGPTTTNATNIGPFVTDTNAIYTDGLGHLFILRNPLDTDGTKPQLDVSSGLFRVLTQYGTYAKQSTNQFFGVPYAALTLEGETNGMGGILYMVQSPTTNIGASQDPITYLNQGAGSLLFSLGGVMQCDGSFIGAGGFWHSITNVAGNYQMGILDSIASVDASGGNVRIYLPPLTNQPVSGHSNWFTVQDGWESGPTNYTRTFTVVRTDNSANTVNILTTNHDVLNASGITNYILGPMRSVIFAETWSNGIATVCPIFDGSGFPSTNANDPNFLPNYFAAGTGISLSTTGAKTTISTTGGSGIPTSGGNGTNLTVTNFVVNGPQQTGGITNLGFGWQSDSGGGMSNLLRIDGFSASGLPLITDQIFTNQTGAASNWIFLTNSTLKTHTGLLSFDVTMNAWCPTNTAPAAYGYHEVATWVQTTSGGGASPTQVGSTSAPASSGANGEAASSYFGRGTDTSGNIYWQVAAPSNGLQNFSIHVITTYQP